MVNGAVSKALGYLVLVTTLLVTLIVTPWNSIEPISTPKVSMLGILGFIAVFLSISQIRLLSSKKFRWLFLATLFFVILLLIHLILDTTDFSFRFYGTPGRNTGFLAYFSLAMLLVASALSSSKLLVKRVLVGLILVGAILALYGIAQWRGFDFFNYVNLYDSNVFGTFGNPNFQSAFMGMVAVASTVWAIFGRLKLSAMLALLLLTLLSLANVVLSSEQGYFNYVAGVVSALGIFLFTTHRKKSGIAVVTLTFTGASLVGLGIFNTGPLADLIFKSSVEARGFYWQAAAKMMIENPLMGVGLDGYGDWYRRSRTQRSASGFVADTAHSIPLDLGSSGGMPLLAAYLLFIFLALAAVIRIVRRSQEFDVMFTVLVSVWVAYQAQSLISINQLGLGVWGWTLTGLLIGYEINTRTGANNESSRNGQIKSPSFPKAPMMPFLLGIMGLVTGLVISLPPYLVATKYYKALQSGNAGAIVESTYLKPYDRTRFLYTAQILVENKLEKEAIQILSDASKIYPDNIAIWSIWSQIASASEQQKINSKRELQRLDPFNQSLG